MSEHLRAAREKLLAAVDDLDRRVAELDAERVMLVAAREALLVVIGPTSASGGATHEVAPRAPAARPASPSAPPHKNGVPLALTPRMQKAAARVEAALVKARGPLRYADLARASEMGNAGAKRVIAALVAAGHVSRTGKTASTRFSLPTGRAKRTNGSAAVPSQGSPADDDGPGAQATDTTVSPSPMEQDAPPPQNRRPPADVVAASGAQGDGVRSAPVAPFHGVDASAIAPLPEAAGDMDESTVDDAEVVHLDAQTHEGDTGDVDDTDDDAFDEPPYRAAPQPQRPAPKPAGYKPGTRQPVPTSTRAKDGASWWMRADADWQGEAERMKTSRGMRVPSQDRVIGWEGVF